jgi:uncharacterized protein (DUF1697 family)
MADLRTVCEAIGWREVRTYIQSGNVVFRARGAPRALERQLETAVADTLGTTTAVIVRTVKEWRQYLRANPFPRESSSAPNLVMLALSQKPAVPEALNTLRTRADSEMIEEAGGALWIYYPEGAGRSRLTPAVLDRSVGSPVTTRNWRTVTKIAELADQLHP